MIKPKRFPKIRFINLRTVGYSTYWGDWKHIKYNLTPRFEKFWSGQIIHIGICAYYIEFDFRRGNMIDQMYADSIVRKLPKN